jgi:hypothetical protein
MSSLRMDDQTITFEDVPIGKPFDQNAHEADELFRILTLVSPLHYLQMNLDNLYDDRSKVGETMPSFGGAKRERPRYTLRDYSAKYYKPYFELYHKDKDF